MIVGIFSALVLFISGLLITVVSAYLSVKGFMLFLTDPSLYYAMLGLGIGFEVAKVIGSTFLFHRLRDKGFPIFLKFLMSCMIASLIFFSGIFSFVHFNSTASEYKTSVSKDAGVIEMLTERNIANQRTIDGFNEQLGNIDKTVVTARINLYNSLKPEKDLLEQEIRANNERIEAIRENTVENDQYKFLNVLADITGKDRESIFAYVLLFIVIVIDPLAISIFISATYMFSKTIQDRKLEKTTKKQDKEAACSNNKSSNKQFSDYGRRTTDWGYNTTVTTNFNVLPESPIEKEEEVETVKEAMTDNIEEEISIEDLDKVDVLLSEHVEDGAIGIIRDEVSGEIIDFTIDNISQKANIDTDGDGIISLKEILAFLESDIFKRRTFIKKEAK